MEPGNYWIPECENQYKPFVGKAFDELTSALQFYKSYARVCGFDIRKCSQKTSKDGTVVSKYFVCNRNGIYVPSDDFVSGKRRCMVARCGCKAKIVVRYSSDHGYVIKKFEERHNHGFATEEGKKFLKVNRNMGLSSMMFCLYASKVNVGAVRSHTMMKEMTGGYNNVGSTSTDFKNMNRDVKEYVGENDAAMILRKFTNTQQDCEGFFFDFDTDEEGHLTKLFWADPIGIRNYELFGDAISVDATFRSNKYKMKFVPFIGIDNHMKIVTFASALIAMEDIESYTWIFETFIRAMGREPRYVVTDECPAMKSAIPDVFKISRHRLCAWHIMRKFPQKLPNYAPDYGKFVKEVSEIVYDNNITIDEFEWCWHTIMSTYGLTDDKWLQKLFRNRRSWVCAFFRDSHMGGLIRTTSISESINSFFNTFNGVGSTLIEFYGRYESAMEKQRNTNEFLNHECATKKPSLKTPMPIEVQMSEVYTRTFFYEVQKQIRSSAFRVISNSDKVVDGVRHFVVSDLDQEAQTFEVKHILSNNHVDCSCSLFVRMGMPCSHMFFVLMHGRVEKLPDIYIITRWRKNAEEKASVINNKQAKQYSTIIKKSSNDLIQIRLDFEICLNSAGFNMEKTEYIKKHIAEMKQHLGVDVEEANPKKNKNVVIEALVGPQVENVFGVQNPPACRTKGCGKRYKSSSEIAKHVPKRRKCASCGNIAGHNSRTCPLKEK